MASVNLTTIATAAAQFLGELDSGESLSAQQLTDALQVANNLIDNFSSDRLMALSATIVSQSTTGGQISYALATRCSAVEAASLIPNSGPTSPLKVVNAVEWAAIPDRGVAGSFIRLLAQASAGAVDPIEWSQFNDPILGASVLNLALQIKAQPGLIVQLMQLAKLSTSNVFQGRYLFYDRGLSTGTIYIAGPPQTGTAQLVTWTAMSQFADTTTTLAMSPGYQRMLTLATAIEIAPQYQLTPTPSLMKSYQEAKAAVRQLNASILGPEPSGGIVSPSEATSPVTTGRGESS